MARPGKNGKGRRSRETATVGGRTHANIPKRTVTGVRQTSTVATASASLSGTARALSGKTAQNLRGLRLSGGAPSKVFSVELTPLYARWELIFTLIPNPASFPTTR